MKEIMEEREAVKPEADLEEIDDWLNRSNRARIIRLSYQVSRMTWAAKAS